MALVLKYREVAQRNIDQFDRLGAFHGETECEYHYGSGLGCAIGICAPCYALPQGGVRQLVQAGDVETDNIPRLILIQNLHDYVAKGTKRPLGRQLRSREITVPESIADVVAGIDCSADLTPEIYKNIMRLLASEPECAAPDTL